MSTLTRDERIARIAELEQELAVLRAEEAAEHTVDEKAIVAECLALKNSGKSIDAVKLYRNKMGCGLREAHYAVQAL